MKSEVKERIYLLIMVFCLLMCMVLIISVLADKPLLVGASDDVYSPAIRPVVYGESTASPDPSGLLVPGEESDDDAVRDTRGYMITEEYLEQTLVSYLPSALSIETLDVKITAEGQMTLCVGIQRSALSDYIKQAGIKLSIKQKLVLTFLPKNIDIVATFNCSTSGNAVTLEAAGLTIDDKVVDTSGLPENVLAMINGGIAALLTAAGDFTSIGFVDGAIVLM